MCGVSTLRLTHLRRADEIRHSSTTREMEMAPDSRDEVNRCELPFNGSLEWGIITTLRDYLIFSLPIVGEFGQLDADGIRLCNARNAFEFELARVFVRPVPWFSADSGRFSDLQAALAKLIVLLGRLANVTGKSQVRVRHFEHLFQHLNKVNEASYYHNRLWSLLEHLETSNLKLHLINRHSGAAFNLPPDTTLLNDLEFVQNLNHLLDTIPLSQYKSQVEGVPPSNTAVDNQDALVRDYAAATFRVLFEHLGTCGTPHKLMLYLPSSKHQNTPSVFLDLLISVCPEHSQWQEAGCGMCETLSHHSRTVTDSNLCGVIEYSQSENDGLRIHVNGSQIQNLSQISEYCRHDGDSPSICLHKMISNGAFKRFNVKSLYADEHQVRFNTDQKRALAVHIAAALSQLLGSEWAGEGWTTKDMYFLGQKKDDNQLPYGPFVSCSSDGPDFTDRTRWAANLVKPPHLILLGKLLLEIDLGEDLDEYINNSLKTTPRKNLSVLLLSLYEKAKPDLFYGEAIQACLAFHKERKLKNETKEIDVPIGKWCGWDRKYIKDKIVTKLTPSPPHSEQYESVSHREHHAKDNKFLYAFSNPLITPQCVNSSLRPLTYRTRDPGDTELSTIPIFTKSIDQTRFAGTTATRQEEHQLNKEVEHPDNPVIGPFVRRRMSTVEGNADVSMWLNASKQDPDVFLDKADSSTFQIEEDEVVLFDDMEDSQPPRKAEANRAADYRERLRNFNNRHFRCLRRAPTDSIIKIALIDTGVDKSDPLVKGELSRITGRSWVDDNPDSYHDTYGHGTHLVRLVLETSQTAHIFVAKVSENKKFDTKNVQNIAEAINWAVKEKMHIISFSLGFKNKVPKIKEALKKAINATYEPIVLAAAGNWGYNYPCAFPASQKGVLPIYAVDGNGMDGHFGTMDLKNGIAALGVNIKSQWKGKEVWISGTSFAAPIAAAIAANTLEFFRQKMDPDQDTFRWRRLSSFEGMRNALEIMCIATDKFLYLAPWHLQNCTDEKIVKKLKNAIDYHKK